MGHAIRPAKVKLIAGLLSSDIGKFSLAKKMLEKKYGPIDLESKILDFTHTKYYEAEMGEELKRVFYCFEKLISPESAYAVKAGSNRIEKSISHEGKRSVNIDPGYLCLSKIVLFSTKDYTHRIYLGKGIYAEVTLFYKGGTFNPFPWTYPDYRTIPYINIFKEMRDIYKKQLKGTRL